MSEPVEIHETTWRERLRGDAGRRVAGMALALLVEALVVLVLLTFTVAPPRELRDTAIQVFGIAPDADDRPEDEVQEEQPAETLQPDRPPAPERAQTQPETPPPPAPEPEAAPEPLNLPVIPMTRDQMAAAEIGRMPRTPAPPAPSPTPRRRQVAGPPDTGGGRAFADTERVAGSGPNGEPLYAAAWYREPTDQEMRGYLSTAQPGYALIACRTVEGYRVEDCIPLEEGPPGSNMMRAVMAATWQFRVRPPMLGGQLRFGEWVRIRITYDNRPPG